jgi:hypothetical protein
MSEGNKGLFLCGGKEGVGGKDARSVRYGGPPGDIDLCDGASSSFRPYTKSILIPGAPYLTFGAAPYSSLQHSFLSPLLDSTIQDLTAR